MNPSIFYEYITIFFIQAFLLIHYGLEICILLNYHFRLQFFEKYH